ncbi:restriction endonuclease subunit S [Microbulbifer sp. A4B17]|uniref:restriction endonuclease subunit S n=1 Tax=Microbulbifer sp. A4B17 TaxID=359370 RepID=UPI000D52AF40|nr:restriction endonuclease subunit S [Microbulbifer sp. A4B17]AWF79512.1 restriction endonuclease subunit S [Microbulbifer sp. A4B17]
MSKTTIRKFKLKELVFRHMSGPSPTCEERSISDTQEWGLLKTTAVVWNGWNPSAHKVPPKQYWNNKNIEVKKGDVIVTKAGPRQRVGVVVYVDETPPQLMVSGKMIGLRPDPKVVDGRVLAAALSSEKVQRYIDSRTTGMAESQLNFTNEFLLNTEVAIPDFEQHPRLGKLISLLSEEARKTEELIFKYQNIRLGIMQDLFTRGITDTGSLRPKHNLSPELYQKHSGTLLPKEWSIKTLGEITNPNHPICYGLVQPGPHDWNGVPIIAIHNLKGSYEKLHYSSRSIESKFSRSRVKEGDVLLSVKATVGRVDVAPDGFSGNVSRDVARIRPIDNVRSKFLKYLLQSEHMQKELMKIVVGSTRMELSINRLKEVPIYIPQPKEQEQIEKKVDAINQLIYSEEQYLEKINLSKSGLMHDILTGKASIATRKPEEAHV